MHTKKVALNQIADSIRDAGYDPYTQLYGYLSTENDSYITRQGNARELIKNVDRTTLEAFIQALRSKQL